MVDTFECETYCCCQCHRQHEKPKEKVYLSDRPDKLFHFLYRREVSRTMLAFNSALI